MINTASSSRAPSLFVAAAALLLSSCSEHEPIGPRDERVQAPQFATLPGTATNGTIATLQRVTARYHDLDAALADGYVFLHPCEERPGAGPVGILYVRFDYLLDGAIDVEKPDALLYEPGKHGRAKLIGVELAVPYGLWTAAQPPQFLGATFQREDEFGVWALHVWVWRHNPEGLFAESHPGVSCDAE
jgi:hypothetical protein